MKTVAITGGVGSGKSLVLSYLKDNYNCKIVRADDVAKELMAMGTECFDKIRIAFQDEDIFAWSDEDSQCESNVIVNSGDAECQLQSTEARIIGLDYKKLAKVIYADEAKRLKINEIVHPAVKKYVLADILREQQLDQIDYYFFEVALCIEEGYDKLLDETWYIYSSVETRRERLISSRGYTNERIDEIIASQKSEAEFRSHSTNVINNDGSGDDTFHQIASILME